MAEQAKLLAFRNACCAIPPPFQKPFFSPHLNSHAILHSTVCTVLNATSKHHPAPSVNCVEYGASESISRYSTTVITVILHVFRGKRPRKPETHPVPADSSQARLAVRSLQSLKFNSSCKSPLTSYPRSLARTIYTCSVSCCFCKRNP